MFLFYFPTLIDNEKNTTNLNGLSIRRSSGCHHQAWPCVGRAPCASAYSAAGLCGARCVKISGWSCGSAPVGVFGGTPRIREDWGKIWIFGIFFFWSGMYIMYRVEWSHSNINLSLIQLDEWVRSWCPRRNGSTCPQQDLRDVEVREICRDSPDLRRWTY